MSAPAPAERIAQAEADVRRDHIRRTVDAAPPLTDEQVRRLRRIFEGSGAS